MTAFFAGMGLGLVGLFVYLWFKIPAEKDF